VIFDVTPVAYGSTGIGRSADMLFVRQDSELFRLAHRNSAKVAKVREHAVSI
jgi:hypothetical protein